MEAVDFNALVDESHLEDSQPLQILHNMIADRISAVKYGDDRYDWKSLGFSEQTTTMDKLAAIRDIIYAIAPKFINMDYPYWDYCWSTFPQMYSSTIIGRDEEHKLEPLPATLSSFNQESILVYRTFLKNAYYWLIKFRYVRSNQSAYDELYYRQWEWRKSPPSFWEGDYTYSATENFQSIENADASTLAYLMNSGQGVVYRTGSSLGNVVIPADMYSSRGISKGLHHGRNTPLTQFDDADIGIQAPRNIEGIPHNLITANPTSFVAEVLWFVVPNSTPFKNHEEWVVTALNSGTVRRWGDQNQFSATEYSAVASSKTVENYTSRRGSDKRIQYESNQRNTSGTGSKHTVYTRWSDDGTRSYDYQDTTTPDSSYPSSSNSLDYEEYVYPTFGGLVRPLSSAPPTFSAGIAAPHETITFHVFDQNALPTDYPIPPAKYPSGETFVFGVTSSSWYRYTGSTRWYPVLDFKDFSTEVPDPEDSGD